ncbi:unnamed protein product [Vitrella brassicaformis CCMP3155]|uniref:Lipase n=1 Tax=Vitrella brassicaformis (strain CCMP3155) TaxID=1169540 RepID=A0A0G4EAA4_VITBC|nr:unnamed protein product [Vitrella brassicaformis CCMP3155]|eukprot:CEL92883.1 unnamed protein product [Vitrella brassicaformis CCMP3155]
MTALLGLLVVLLLAFNAESTSLTHFDAREPKYCSTCLGRFIQDHDYPVESDHFVATADDYILRLIRLPNKGRPVIFLNHGLFASAWCWFWNAPQAAPAMLLHRSGFDVWISNSRGTVFSRNHTRLHVESEEFWSFTWQDMAEFDVPATIQYILNETSQDDLIYVGHSQGTTQMLGALTPLDNGGLLHTSEGRAGQWGPSDLLEHRAVRLFVQLSPIAFVRHLSSPLAALLGQVRAAWELRGLGMKAFPADGAEAQLLREGLRLFCQAIGSCPCLQFVRLLLDSSVRHDNASDVDWSFTWFPDAASVQDLEHFEQLYLHGRFSAFDYGWIGNRRHYHQWHAPSFLLDKWPASVPVALFRAGVDELSSKQDVDRLKAALPSGSVVYDRTYDGFGHITWLMGTNDTHHWMKDLLDLCRQYPPRQQQKTVYI